MCNTKTALGIEQNDPAVPVEPIFQIIYCFCRDPLWKISSGDAVGRPLG